MQNQSKEWADYLLKLVAEQNPYRDPKLATLWAVGYLSAHLGSIMSEDPILARRIIRSMDKQYKR